MTVVQRFLAFAQQYSTLAPCTYKESCLTHLFRSIPFTLNGDLFANGHRPRVSLKIYNVLAQLVAVPILQGTGQALADLELTCGTVGSSPCAFTAYWDGMVLNSQTEAASGVYIYQLIVDGRRFTKKMIVMK